MPDPSGVRHEIGPCALSVELTRPNSQYLPGNVEVLALMLEHEAFTRHLSVHDTSKINVNVVVTKQYVLVQSLDIHF
jgi:hypothetical protein